MLIILHFHLAPLRLFSLSLVSHQREMILIYFYCSFHLFLFFFGYVINYAFSFKYSHLAGTLWKWIFSITTKWPWTFTCFGKIRLKRYFLLPSVFVWCLNKAIFSALVNASSDFQCCDRNVRRILNGSIAIPVENSILTKTFRSYQVITLAYILYEQHPHSKYYSTWRYQTLNDGILFPKSKSGKAFW